MKTTILAFFIALLASCSNDSTDKDPVFQLPAETQTGANTFGVTIKGKVYVPRDPAGFNFGPQGKGMIWWGDHTANDHLYNELVVVDGASALGFKMVIHIQDIYNLGIGEYVLCQSNFKQGIDSVPNTHMYFYIWDNNIKNYAYYGSVENQGEIKITRYDGSLTVNWILSGTFKGKFARYNHPDDIIEINDGRFDINLNTINTTPFP